MNPPNAGPGKPTGRRGGRGRSGRGAPSSSNNHPDENERMNASGRGRGGRTKRRNDSSSRIVDDDDRPGVDGNLDARQPKVKAKSNNKNNNNNNNSNSNSNNNATRTQNGANGGRNRRHTGGHGNNSHKNNNNSNHSNNNNAPSNNYNNDKDNNDNQLSKPRKSRTKKIRYEPHRRYDDCLRRYHDASSSNTTTTNNTNTTIDSKNATTIIRGKLRVMPSKHGTSFVSCDRGSIGKDVVIENELMRNRALDGDYVFVELLSDDNDEEEGRGNSHDEKTCRGDVTLGQFMDRLGIHNDAEKTAAGVAKDESNRNVNNGESYQDNVEYEEEEYVIDEQSASMPIDNNNNNHFSTSGDSPEMWHDDQVQVSLWDPLVNLRRKTKRSNAAAAVQHQRRGKVICIVPPESSMAGSSELTPADESHRTKKPSRTVVGTLSKLSDGGDKYLLSPNNKALPRFMCPPDTGELLKLDNEDGAKTLYKAEYVYGTWGQDHKWPPCTAVARLCGSCNVRDETKALLVEHDVDHGDFPPAVLREVDDAVKSGRFVDASGEGGEAMGWKPTEEMLRGRRDYRNHRIFTIDPTTARDLDDALHITELEDGRVEIGVHIADVSHFVPPESAVDEEALRRATTVYLVDRVLPMLPRPLCEIACSLNENVERLAFSCVWRMNLDGNMSSSNRKGKKSKDDDVWYGRTVIKSCARLDYATAQNIIDRKVATGEKVADEMFWPKSRQPTGGHTIDEVAADVRLMHTVAMARRKLRFENGALALNGIKLTFQLEDDGETPKMCAPYPLRDSNRLIEEYMLLANFLVAQRLITHAKGRALLRQHAPPLEAGLQTVVEVSKESFNFDIDVTSSQTLQESLSRLSRTCSDDLVIQCVTESLMAPMRPAEYIAAGEIDEEDWQHFALNIPYYTHFTSPIRRYADVIVHRLLQATLDDTVDECLPQKQIHADAMHCNDKRMSSKKAQERSDRVFLSLYLKKNPIESALGVCLGIGEKTFTVFVPSLGLSTRVFLDEHVDVFDMNVVEDDGGRRKLVIRPKSNVVPGMDVEESDRLTWKSMSVSIFTKLTVACYCKDRTPIDVMVKVIGPWME